MEKIIDQVFGESIVPSRAQETFIKGIVENSPVAVFDTLGKFLDEKGYKLMVILEHDGQDFTVVV